jgi:glycosyltransferase involved in cell wall biosynthesis
MLRERGETPVELQLTLDRPGHGAQRGQHTTMPASEHSLLAALDNSVRYLGVLRYEQIWQAYHQADVFVFPSLCESFGHPLVEAMAAGLPVVASDIAVHREICGDAAHYFPARDAGALAARLAALAADANQRAALSRCGASRVRNFLWEDHVQRLLALLRDLSTARTAREAMAANVA